MCAKHHYRHDFLSDQTQNRILCFLALIGIPNNLSRSFSITSSFSWLIALRSWISWSIQRLELLLFCSIMSSRNCKMVSSVLAVTKQNAGFKIVGWANWKKKKEPDSHQWLLLALNKSLTKQSKELQRKALVKQISSVILYGKAECDLRGSGKGAIVFVMVFSSKAVGDHLRTWRTRVELDPLLT